MDLISAAPGVLKREQDEAVVSVYQEGAGTEQPGQPQAHAILTKVMHKQRAMRSAPGSHLSNQGNISTGRQQPKRSASGWPFPGRGDISTGREQPGQPKAHTILTMVILALAQSNPVNPFLTQVVVYLWCRRII